MPYLSSYYMSSYYLNYPYWNTIPTYFSGWNYWGP